MHAPMTFSRRVASAVLLAGIALGGCSVATTTPAPTLQQQIEAARTRADHETLVAYYNKEATAARAKAAEHRKMGKSYQSQVASGRGGASMPSHCNALASNFDSAAAEFDGMAASHRQMAEQAKP